MGKTKFTQFSKMRDSSSWCFLIISRGLVFRGGDLYFTRIATLTDYFLSSLCHEPYCCSFHQKDLIQTIGLQKYIGLAGQGIRVKWTLSLKKKADRWIASPRISSLAFGPFYFNPLCIFVVPKDPDPYFVIPSCKLHESLNARAW